MDPMDSHYELSSKAAPRTVPSGYISDDGLAAPLIEETDSYKVRTATIAGSVFNLSNTIIGSGVLALPFAFKISGILLGNVFVIIVAILGFQSVNMIIRAEEAYRLRMGIARHGTSSYGALAQAALGNWGRYVTDGALVVNCFGGMASYLVILADLLEPVFHFIVPSTAKWLNRTVIILTSLIILLPISSMKSMNALRFTSAIALCSIAYLVVLIIIKGGISLGEGSLVDNDLSFASFTFELFRTVPLISFAFTCHQNVMPVFNEVVDPTKSRMRKISFGAYMVCYIAYATVATMGYFIFFDETDGNILNNWPHDNLYVVVARIGVSLTIMFSYPMQAFPALRIIERFFWPGKGWSWMRHELCLIAIVLPQVFIAIFVESVDLIFGLSGAIASTTVCFILPGIFTLKLVDDASPKFKFLARTMVVLGAVFMVASAVVTVVYYIKDNDPNPFDPKPTVGPTAAPGAYWP
mmetsp:Transcript_15630/g.17367  ORF Transcript_15630/g.17367 Transcript_15630/m.17367 type:complete len:468 (+) Transcript_15630:34-1437(+)|eukprot:CAMPEP_0205831994 /NCGR_PEP_ID=MMETSP0206-20130828/45701_1 /ASSEMBLY_ACC=CAM_ASM_000279 /TAXON_ID=36767 /ORGANISM="Euplotes focardii, Strain TN1" /LENGTH=467 /DNA_ID=CAMNT_0053137135 /DNA_START=28 /DNA_END=1431 /DNA_ORIENTATION=+